MKKALFLVALAAMLGAVAAYPAAVQYLRIDFVSGNATIDTAPVYSMGQEGVSYSTRADGALYYRAHYDPDLPVVVKAGKPSFMELSTTMPDAAMGELDWLAQNGVLVNFSESDREGALNAINGFMVISADKANATTSCCKIFRRIAPAAKEDMMLTDLKLPQEPLGIMAAAAYSVPPQPEIAPVAGMPAAGGAAEKRGITNEKSASAAQDAAAPMASPAQKSGILETAMASPFALAFGVIVISAIAVYMFAYRQQAVVMQEPPEVQQALASETKVAIMSDLMEVERIPTDISNRLGKSKATVSEHLEQLVATGLVEKVEMEGRKFVYYRLSHKGKAALLRRKMAA